MDQDRIDASNNGRILQDDDDDAAAARTLPTEQLLLRRLDVSASTKTPIDVAAMAVANVERCARLQHCQGQSRHWLQECQQLKRQQRQAAISARLQACPVHTWQNLSKKEKWSKANVLAVLHMNRTGPRDEEGEDDEDYSDDESDDETTSTASRRKSSNRSHVDLPRELTEESLATNNAIPRHLVEDRDVFLARLNTRQCRVYLIQNCHVIHEQAAHHILSSSNATDQATTSPMGPLLEQREEAAPTFPPRCFLLDTIVWHCIAERHAHLLQSLAASSPSEISFVARSIPGHLWHEATFFQSVCSGILDLFRPFSKKLLRRYHFEGSVVSSMSRFQGVLQRFLPSIRNNVNLVQSVLTSCSKTQGNRDSISGSTSAYAASEFFEFICLVIKPCQWYDQPWFQFHGDKKFALYVVDLVSTLPDNALQAFAKPLQNDEEFVTAVVTKNGLCLQHANIKFRRDIGVCQAACESTPLALVHCRVPALRNDPIYVARYFSSVNRTDAFLTPLASTASDIELHDSVEKWDRRLYMELPPGVKEMPDVSFAALFTGYVVAISELPLSLQENEAFWKRVLSVCPETWFQLPIEITTLRHTAEMARAITSFPTIGLVEDLFDRFPDLLLDRALWLKIVSQGHQVIEFLALAPDTMWSDKDIILAAVRCNFEVLALLHGSPLYEDRDVLAAALECGVPEALYAVEPWLQLLYPDLVALFIRSCDIEEDIFEVYDGIEAPLWHDTQVVYAWLSRGGDYLHDEFLPEIADDPEAFLLIAQHNPEDFLLAADTLLADREFMARVVEVNPTLLLDSPIPELTHDFDLTILALGGPTAATASASSPSLTSAALQRKRRDLIGLYDLDDPDDFEFLTELAAFVHEQVVAHERFVTLILAAMTTSGKSPKRQQPQRTLRPRWETTRIKGHHWPS